MIAYVLTDDKGTYIRENPSGNFSTIRNAKFAARFTNLMKANIALMNQVPLDIRQNFVARTITIDNKIQKHSEIPQVLASKPIENDNIDEWICKIQEIEKIMNRVELCQEALNSKLSEIDKQIVDIQHYIEFGNFNAYQGFLCFKSLQNILRQRRQYKNELSAMQMIKDRIDKQTMHTLEEKLARIHTKDYKPRAIPELFVSSTVTK